MIKLNTWLLCSIIIICTLSGCNKENTPDTVRIGVILPLSGDYAKIGDSIKNSIEIAYDDERDKLKQKVEFIFEDSQGQTKLAVNSTNKLINTDNVAAIIGEISSTVTLAMVPITEKNKVVLISPSASSPMLSNIGSYFYRTCSSDIKEAEVMADHIFNKYENKKVSLIYINNDYGLGLKKAFCHKYELLGGKILISESYEEGSSDFKTSLTKIKYSGTNLIYLPGYAKEVGMILKQSKELNVNATYFGTIDLENPQVKEIAGNAAEGVIYTAYAYDPSNRDAVTKKFVDKFQQKYKLTPAVYDALGYDAAKLILMAIRNGAKSSDEIQIALNNLRNYEGVTGTINFEKGGDVTKGIILKVIKKEKSENI